jgi:hypothetical protein
MHRTVRRVFLREGAMALLALGVPPAFLTRSVFAAVPGGRRKVLVCIDLARTTDFRDLFAEVAALHLGATRLDRVFPGHPIDARAFPGVIRRPAGG